MSIKNIQASQIAKKIIKSNEKSWTEGVSIVVISFSVIQVILKIFKSINNIWYYSRKNRKNK